MFIIPRRFRGIKRFEQILRILAKYELGFLLEKIHLKKRSLLPRKKNPIPAELRKMFEELGGSFIKLGQLLSLRPDLIPQEYCDELSKLQDKVPPISYAEVEHVLKLEFGKPIKKLFRSFDKKPIASASIGQVHIARLMNGKKVAVKVMRTSIKNLFETDIEILEYLARLIKHHVRQSIVDPEEVVQEFKQYTENELDYLKEAHNIKMFYNNFRNDKRIIIPAVHEKLTTHRVLVMDFVEGIELKDIISHAKQFKQVNKKRIASLIVYSFMKQIFVDGFFHADPHPANILVNKEKIGLIDFGIIGRLDEELKEKLGLLFISMIHRDANGMVKSFISLNMVDSDVDVNGLKEDIRNTLGEYYDTGLEKMDFAELFFKSIGVAKKHDIRLPKDFVLLGKSLVTLQGVGIELNPYFNLVRETKPFIDHLVNEKRKPSYLAQRLARETTRFAEFVQGLPDESQKVYKTIQKADIALDSINTDLRSLTREVRVEGWRIIIGVIIAALVIGASLVYNAVQWMGVLFIIIACILVIQLLFSIVYDSVKRKKA
ncbi:AarF/ABC1/UbiB kinase family protein [Candidatus Woesearchaeota archaeon]|nr:AarF/ABC1/UbiB kinase family protein [Candidatus Woesearchaeota archaeon]